MIVGAGRAKWRRGILMVVAYPLVAGIIVTGTVLTFVWAAGYGAMALRSMMV